MIDLSTQLRSYFDETNPPFDVADLMTEQAPVALGEAPGRWRSRRWVTAAAAASVAAVTLVAAIGGAVWLLRGEEPIGPVEKLNLLEVDDIPAFRATVENSSVEGRRVYQVSYEGPGGGMRWELVERVFLDPDTGETTDTALRGYVSSVWDGDTRAGQVLREDVDIFERREFASRDEALSSSVGPWDLTWPTGGWSARCSGGETDPLRGTNAVVGTTEVAGRAVTQFQCTTVRDAWTVWADTETGLLMRTEGELVSFAFDGGFGRLEITSIEIDPEFPSDFFDVSVPAGAVDESELDEGDGADTHPVIEDSVAGTAPFYLRARYNWPNPVRTVEVWWQSRDRWRVEVVEGEGAGSYAIAGEPGLGGFYNAAGDTWESDPFAGVELPLIPVPVVDITPPEIFLVGGGVGPAFVPRFDEAAAAIASVDPGEAGCDSLPGGSMLGRSVESWSCRDGELAVDPATGFVLEWIYEGATGYEVLEFDTAPVFDPSLFVFEPRGSEKPDDPLQLLVGSPAPEMRGELLRGGGFDLAELRGERVVLLIWASWCGSTCLDAMDDFDAAAAARSDLTFVAPLYFDDPAAAADAVATGGYSVPVVVIPDDDPAFWQDTWPLLGVPTTVFVDADGTIVAVHGGLLGFDGVRDTLERLGW